MPTKDSPKAKPDNATGEKAKHTQDVENKPDNKPAKAASDKDNNGKGDNAEKKEAQR